MPITDLSLEMKTHIQHAINYFQKIKFLNVLNNNPPMSPLYIA